ncbi:MAG: DNA-binding response regulator, AraC family [Labilithrix sp.]|nr:DNA-binding response regulator, AraC family [Labilithrix sp.]
MDLRPIAVERQSRPPATARDGHARTTHGRATQPPTTHTNATLAIYTAGRSRVQLNGEWDVGAGDVLVVPAGAQHRLLESREAELWRLTFSVPCLAPSTAESLFEPFERVRDGACAVARVRSSRQDHLERLLVELERVGRERRGAGDVVESVERSLLTLVLAEIDEATGAVQTPRAPEGGVVARALRVIERRCLGPLGLRDVAAAVQRSPAHVTTALTRATGCSAVQWIVTGRMAEARRLLIHSDASIETITERVGYADSTHFIRMFRREHGTTPAAWRAAQALSSSHT